MPTDPQPSLSDAISTDSVSERDKLEFWSDLVCHKLIAVECATPVPNGAFHGSVHMGHVGDLGVALVGSCAQTVTRSHELIAKADQEYLLLNIQRRGTSRLSQRGKEASLAVGDMALYSSVEPYRLEFDDVFAQTVLMLPAASLRYLNPDIDRVLGCVLQGATPLARMLTAMADHCFDLGNGALKGRSAQHLSDAMAETLAAGILELGPGGQAQQSTLARYHLQRIQRFVLDHLGDSTLSVATVAQALRLSPAHIHRVFEGQPRTFGAWLLSARLRAARGLLVHPAKSHLPVSQIAYACGFNNAAHFSRAFRDEFRMSPTEWRARNATFSTANADFESSFLK